MGLRPRRGEGRLDASTRGAGERRWESRKQTLLPIPWARDDDDDDDGGEKVQRPSRRRQRPAIRSADVSPSGITFAAMPSALGSSLPLSLAELNNLKHAVIGNPVRKAAVLADDALVQRCATPLPSLSEPAVGLL
jgi:hypothetical protein